MGRKLKRVMDPTNPWGRDLRKMPRPRNDAELAILTTIYFGAPVGIADLYVRRDGEGGACSGGYEVREDYNSYHGRGFVSSECFYDADSSFWRRVFGPLTCGGVARVSYGQFRATGHREMRRLLRWMDMRRSGSRGCSLRRPLQRLAERYGLGENRVTRDSSVLTGGRADGAQAGSFSSREAR